MEKFATISLQEMLASELWLRGGLGDPPGEEYSGISAAFPTAWVADPDPHVMIGSKFSQQVRPGMSWIDL